MDCVVLKYRVCSEDRIELEVEVHKDNSQLDHPRLFPEVCSHKKLDKLSRDMWPVLEKAVDFSGSMDPAVAVGHIEKIKEYGAELRRMLLPDPLVQYLEKPDCPYHITFRCDPMLNGVPFDHIFVGGDFISFKRPVGKQLLNDEMLLWATSIPQRGSYQALALIDPGGLFQDAMREEELKRFKDAAREFADCRRSERLRGKIEFVTKSRGSKGDVAKAVRDNHFVFLACHHFYNEDNPGLSGFLLAEAAGNEPNELFTAENLLESVGAGDQPPHVLLSASCESGVTEGWDANWRKNKGLYGMVDAALRIGIPHYISTSVEIPACNSLAIASPFFAEIASGRTVGESLRRARLAFRGQHKTDACHPGTALGLAFMLYGNPANAYFCARGHRTSSHIHHAPVGCCSILDDGRPCGAVVCQKDDGYHKSLCSEHFMGQQIKCSAGHSVGSRDALHLCSVEGCTNVFCSQCRGAGQSKCWFHLCHEGHEVTDDRQRKICSGKHQDDEKRVVCPKENGWEQGLCDECYDRWFKATNTGKQGPVCPHCGRYINPANPWFAACYDCGRQVCSYCGRWHKETIYCPDTRPGDSLRVTRNRNWLRLIEERAFKDPKMASHQRLQQLLEFVKSFQDNVLVSIGEETWRLRLMPRLSPPSSSPGEIQRVIGMEEEEQEKLGKRLFAKLNDWELPMHPGLQEAWQPPKEWLDHMHQVNRVCVNVVEAKGIRGKPILVAVCSLVPVEWQSDRGPVLVDAESGHIEKVRRVVKEWWQAKNSGTLPDLYMVVHSPVGWAPTCKPVYGQGHMPVLVTPSGGDWSVQSPPIEGMPEHVRAFMDILQPRTTYMRLHDIRAWIEEYLSKHDYVTVHKTRKNITEQSGQTMLEREICRAFEILADEPSFELDKRNGQPVLRHVAATM